MFSITFHLLNELSLVLHSFNFWVGGAMFSITFVSCIEWAGICLVSLFIY